MTWGACPSTRRCSAAPSESDCAGWCAGWRSKRGMGQGSRRAGSRLVPRGQRYRVWFDSRRLHSRKEFEPPSGPSAPGGVSSSAMQSKEVWGQVVGSAHITLLRLQADGPEDVAQEERRLLRASLEDFLEPAQAVLDPLHGRSLEHLLPAPTSSRTARPSYPISGRSRPEPFTHPLTRPRSPMPVRLGDVVRREDPAAGEDALEAAAGELLRGICEVLASR